MRRPSSRRRLVDLHLKGLFQSIRPVDARCVSLLSHDEELPNCVLRVAASAAFSLISRNKGYGGRGRERILKI